METTNKKVSISINPVLFSLFPKVKYTSFLNIKTTFFINFITTEETFHILEEKINNIKKIIIQDKDIKEEPGSKVENKLVIILFFFSFI